MSIAYIIVGIVLAVALLGSATAKLTRNKLVVENLTRAGVPLRMFPFLAGCEIAGAAGLIIGIWFGPLGLAAAIGLVLYFLGAIGAHLRKRDIKGSSNAVVFLIVSVVVLVLSITSP